MLFLQFLLTLTIVVNAALALPAPAPPPSDDELDPNETSPDKGTGKALSLGEKERNLAIRAGLVGTVLYTAIRLRHSAMPWTEEDIRRCKDLMYLYRSKIQAKNKKDVGYDPNKDPLLQPLKISICNSRREVAELEKKLGIALGATEKAPESTAEDTPSKIQFEPATAPNPVGAFGDRIPRSSAQFGAAAGLAGLAASAPRLGEALKSLASGRRLISAFAQ